MPRRVICSTTASLLAALLSLMPQAGAAPFSLTYQAYLSDVHGEPIDGMTDLVLSLYATEIGGAAAWSESMKVEVTQGLLTARLGHPGNPLPHDLFAGRSYLGVTVKGDPEMTPRLALGSVPHAFRAGDTDTLAGAPAATFDQSAHASSGSNPHGVSAAQIGAASAGDVAALAADVITSVSTGSGLSGGAAAGEATLAVDDAYVQRRIAVDCPAGESIRGVAVDGSVVCEAVGEADTNAGTLCGTGEYLDGSGQCTKLVRGSSTSAGFFAMRNQNTGSANTAFGGYALYRNETGSRNTAVGYNTLRDTDSTDNAAVGYYALYRNTTGRSNSALGASALHANTIGVRNTAIGHDALARNVEGLQNTAMGAHALARNTSGINNTAIGMYAMHGATTGHGSVAVGAYALDADAAGASNTAVGNSALTQATGSFNTALGRGAGGELITGSHNLYVAHPGADGESSTMRIGGSQTRAFVQGIRGVTTGLADAVPVLVDGDGQLGTISSSARYKDDVEDLGDVSERLLALRPVKFRYKVRTARSLEFGLIAEEVAEVFPELVIRDRDGRPETVRYHVLSTLLLNELHATRGALDAAAARIAGIEREQAKLVRIEARLHEMEASLMRLAPSPR